MLVYFGLDITFQKKMKMWMVNVCLYQEVWLTQTNEISAVAAAAATEAWRTLRQWRFSDPWDLLPIVYLESSLRGLTSFSRHTERSRT